LKRLEEDLLLQDEQARKEGFTAMRDEDFFETEPGTSAKPVESKMTFAPSFNQALSTIPRKDQKKIKGPIARLKVPKSS